MGVYINVEMPKSCRACHLKMNCDDCEGLECFCVPLHQKIGYLDDLLVDKRRDNCPLVPVPPHGRLIDADALWVEINKICDRRDAAIITDLTCIQQILSALRHSPTIIPAEEAWTL